MSASIARAFARAGRENRAAFIPYVTGGFPDHDACLELIQALARSGADIIEVGIPFSDPLADGPVIQAAGQAALEAGATPESVLGIIARASAGGAPPLVIMTYWNPVLQAGPERFAGRAAEAGAAGVIVPDLPPEEAALWVEATRESGLDAIFMAAPTTPPDRLKMVCRAGSGFLYYVSMTGVTGSELKADERLLEKLAKVRRASPLPVAVGFGVAEPAQAAILAKVADGVIVGSALVREMASDREGGLKAAADLAAGISASLGR